MSNLDQDIKAQDVMSSAAVRKQKAVCRANGAMEIGINAIHNEHSELSD